MAAATPFLRSRSEKAAAEGAWRWSFRRKIETGTGNGLSASNISKNWPVRDRPRPRDLRWLAELLHLLITFFTVGPKEAHGPCTGATAPNAAGEIHSDFEKVSSAPKPSPMTIVTLGERARHARQANSAPRVQVVQDGDVMHFCIVDPESVMHAHLTLPILGLMAFPALAWMQKDTDMSGCIGIPFSTRLSLGHWKRYDSYFEDLKSTTDSFGHYGEVTWEEVLDFASKI